MWENMDKKKSSDYRHFSCSTCTNKTKTINDKDLNLYKSINIIQNLIQKKLKLLSTLFFIILMFKIEN